MLDLNDWIPEETSGVKIIKKTTSKVQRIMQFWSEYLGIPSSRFRKPNVCFK